MWVVGAGCYSGAWKCVWGHMMNPLYFFLLVVSGADLGVMLDPTAVEALGLPVLPAVDVET